MQNDENVVKEEIQFTNLISQINKTENEKKKIEEEDYNFLVKDIDKINENSQIFSNARNFDIEKRLSIECKPIDELLNGGFPLERLIEIYGEAGAGKTQIALMIALNFLKKNGNYCQWVNTSKNIHETKFDDIITRVSNNNQFLKEKMAKNFVEETINDHDNFQGKFQAKIKEIFSKIQIKKSAFFVNDKLDEEDKARKLIIIVDNIYSQVYAEQNYQAKESLTKSIGKELITLRNKRVSIQVLNNVVDSFQKSVLDNDKKKQVAGLGLTWENFLDERIRMKKVRDSVRKIKVEFSKNYNRNNCKVQIKNDGLHEVYD